ncbi:hypothetical protein H4219_000314 [Mycoemilia scoparia]|uniref:Uncharacterized protein n=1 Tax=Mycoemilia scoparia TaxID=417184 RepID=A0A9W8DT85_9FUNG|nr:hypothetical protein H4219_000314 [Mycoemilia scoparia]
MAENSTPIVKNGKNIDLQNGLPTITEESYNTEMLLRLCTSESSTIQLLNGVAIKIDTINEAVERRRRYTEARNMIDKLEHLVKLKEAKLLRLQRNYGEVIQYIDKKRRENESRKIKIEKVKKHINCIPKYLGEVEVIVSQSRIILQDSQDSLDRRRSVLVLDLSDIFPINLVRLLYLYANATALTDAIRLK